MTSDLVSSSNVLGNTVGTEVGAIVNEAERLGLSWTVRPATMISDFMAFYDGDTTDEAIRVIKINPDVTINDRVMVMFVPPSANFVIGFAPGAHATTRVSRCTVASSNSSNTAYQTPTGMSVINLRAGQTYYVDCGVHYTTAAATTGINLRLNFNGTSTDNQFIGYIQGSTVTTFTRVNPTLNANAWASADTPASVATARVSGYVIADTDGDLSLQYRSEVNLSAATISVGTYLAVSRAKIAV